jgi:hypothetical protein
MTGKRAHPIERFWSKVRPGVDDACWLWSASLNPDGYGQFRQSRLGTVTAHRFSWQVHYGPIPDGMCVCHKCDVPACVRPDHLFLGTVADNMRDRDRKHRRIAPCGEIHARAKLTAERIDEARRCVADGETRASVAKRMGVGPTAISRALLGRSWKHLGV